LKVDQRKVEQKKFGIEYDDDYDYLQHLRDPCAPPEKYSFQVDKQEEDDDEEEEEEDEDNVKKISIEIFELIVFHLDNISF
jgi:hypothetical protein